MRRLSVLLALGASILISACGNPSDAGDGSVLRIDSLNFDPASLGDAQIAKAAALRVYFEHASVGGNICDGLSSLAASEPRYSSGRASGDLASALAWFGSSSGLVDNNRGNPGAQAKVDYFKSSFSGASAGGKLDVAMFKFCFIDTPSSAAELFAYAKAAMESLEAKDPSVTFVWWTMPIQTSSEAERQSYNDLVRSYCASNGQWLFDIASIESHRDSGAAALDGSGREVLCAEYSSDGGHLNAVGSLKVAKAFWRLLAEIAKAR